MRAVIYLKLFKFQSPRNRVKCSESMKMLAKTKTNGKFQSPRNRVKCSELDCLLVASGETTKVSIP